MPDTGVSFTAVTLGEPRYARAELEELWEWGRLRIANWGNVREEPLNRRAGAEFSRNLQQTQAHACGFATPIILAEPSDNHRGGAQADGVDLLRALVSAGIENAAVAITIRRPSPRWPPPGWATDARYRSAGRGCAFGGGPFSAEFEFVSRSDGRFALEDPHSIWPPCAAASRHGACVP